MFEEEFETFEEKPKEKEISDEDSDFIDNEYHEDEDD
jgi:hypothetical protein